MSLPFVLGAGGHGLGMGWKAPRRRLGAPVPGRAVPVLGDPLRAERRAPLRIHQLG